MGGYCIIPGLHIQDCKTMIVEVNGADWGGQEKGRDGEIGLFQGGAVDVGANLQ